MKDSILISACLLGLNCRYDGSHQKLQEMDILKEKFILIPVCPEQAGGLSTPRIPCEIQCKTSDIFDGKGKVLNREGKDCTEAFIRGAREALFLTEIFRIKKALLKDGSPSCGSTRIYDGSFSGKCIPGEGITSWILKKQGVQIYNEKQVKQL